MIKRECTCVSEREKKGRGRRETARKREAVREGDKVGDKERRLLQATHLV